MPTTSDAVHPHRAMRTSSIGLLAVFSVDASTTTAWPDVAWPMNRSPSAQIVFAVIIFTSFLHTLPAVVGTGFRVNQDAEQFGRVLLESDFEVGLNIVHSRER